MNKDDLIKNITTATNKAVKLLEEENINQFKAFFTEVENVDGTKYILPKIIKFTIPITDPVTNNINFKKINVPLLNLVPVNFLELKNISISIDISNTDKVQKIVSFSNDNNSFETLVEAYTKVLVG